MEEGPCNQITAIANVLRELEKHRKIADVIPICDSNPNLGWEACKTHHRQGSNVVSEEKSDPECHKAGVAMALTQPSETC